MQSQRASAPASSGLARFLPYLTGILIIYGALGVAINLRLFPLLVDALTTWLGGRVAWGAPLHLSFLSPLESHYDSRPWLPWAAWLVGAALLSLRRGKPDVDQGSEAQGRNPSEDHVSRITYHVQSSLRTRTSWLPLAILVALVLAGGIGRMVELWPESYGLSRLPYDDEGVYAGTSQLFLQGILPYRDYFFAHPPVAAIAYAPAMSYHFTEWGSPTSFMMARYLSVFYSLITLVLIFGIGYRLAGTWGGTIAGGLWAIDGRVVEINRKIMLEGPLVLLSCAAVLLYLYARTSLTTKDEGRKTNEVPQQATDNRQLTTDNKIRNRLAFFFVGVLAVLSALTKIAGLACLLAIAVDLLWLWLETRRPRTDPQPIDDLSNRQPATGNRQLTTKSAFLPLVLGALVAFLVVVGPFLILAPSQFLREVLFFQFLRPSDGVTDSSARIGDLTATLANALTPLLTALGFIVLSIWVYTSRRGSLGPWRIAILWTFFSLLLFTYSRSFYQHYYIQLAAPFCILAAGTNLLPNLLARLTRPKPTSNNQQPITKSSVLSPQSSVLVLLLPLLALPLLIVQWTGMTTRQCPHCEDHIFEIVARYANNAVPPGSPILSTDEQFNILAARPPSHLPATGYLIDSYGHMISLSLNLDTRDWDDLLSSALQGEHGSDPYAVMQAPRAQSDFLERAAQSPLIIVHERGFARLSDAAIATLNSTYPIAEQQPRYTIYRNPSSPTPR